MSDDPSQRHRDARTVSSSEEYEVRYFVDQMVEETGQPRDAVEAAYLAARSSLAGSEDREKLRQAVITQLTRADG